MQKWFLYEWIKKAYHFFKISINIIKNGLILKLCNKSWLIQLLHLKLNFFFLHISEWVEILHVYEIISIHFMSILAKLTFYALSKIFKELAYRKFLFIIYMQKFTLIFLFTFISDPLHANNLFFFHYLTLFQFQCKVL